MFVLWMFVLALLMFVLIRYHWSRRHLYLTAVKLNGPIGLPIIGVPLAAAFCKTEDFLNMLTKIIEEADNPLCVWLGRQLIAIFKEPRQVEKILSSSKFNQKHDVYALLKEAVGRGLTTASGSEYKLHKKIIQPLLDLQFTTNCMEIFEKHIKICIEKLKAFENQDYFDITEAIHLCTTDIIGETILGYNIRAQDKNNMEYIEAFNEIYDVPLTRLLNPWLGVNLIFKFSSLGKKYKKNCNLIREFMQNVIQESDIRKRSLNANDSYITPIVDEIAQCSDFNSISMERDELLSQHLATLFMASQDTTALTITELCLCFGMYPQYQDRAVQEIYDVLGETCQRVSVDDVNKLVYLDMCIKEVLRIFPVAPFILRQTLEDQKIDKWHLPKSCGVMIPIYNIHRDPKYWENANHFYPDHFLPEVEKNRPSYAYLPFSAGPRGCIAKTFANIGIKVVMVHLLRQFKIEAEGKVPDKKLKMDFSVRLVDGCKVKIKRRM